MTNRLNIFPNKLKYTWLAIYLFVLLAILYLFGTSTLLLIMISFLPLMVLTIFNFFDLGTFAKGLWIAIGIQFVSAIIGFANPNSTTYVKSYDFAQISIEVILTIFLTVLNLVLQNKSSKDVFDSRRFDEQVLSFNESAISDSNFTARDEKFFRGEITKYYLLTNTVKADASKIAEDLPNLKEVLTLYTQGVDYVINNPRSLAESGDFFFIDLQDLSDIVERLNEILELQVKTDVEVQQQNRLEEKLSDLTKKIQKDYQLFVSTVEK
ncbi:MAG: hypothetical protein LBM27_02565 [Lactobacillaceae bacterium]|jgi:5-bromo-4-chloroindolyl phosphate hydrolysis protein|nr:hypothetical protein [Lactobacillaceae bacterium]